MNEPMSVPPSGPGASAPTGTRALTPSTAAALAGRLLVGMQVELLPGRSISPELIEARLRPLEGQAAWTPSIRVQLTTALPASGLQIQASTTERLETGTPPTALRAEVVATSPALVLRLLSPADRSTLPPNQTATDGSREWLGQQFRQHWPESRPLAATLENITARLAKEIGADFIAIPKTVLPPTTTPAVNANDATGPLQIQRAVATLVGQLATATDLTDPEQLSIAVGRSGLWLEALLAQAAIDPAQSSELKHDLKAQLLTLAQRLRLQATSPPSPPFNTQATPGRRPDVHAPQPNLPAQADSPAKPVPAPAGTEPRLGANTGQAGIRLHVARPEQAAPSTLEDGLLDKVPDQADRHLEPLSQKRAQVDQDTTLLVTPSRATRTTPVMPPPATPDESKPAPPAEQESQRANNLAREVESMVKQVVTKQLQSLDSPTSQRALATLIGQLATAAELTDPEQLSIAVGRSGLWLEALLAQAAIDPAQASELTRDIKTQLLTLAQQIRLQGTRQPGAPSGDQPMPERRPDSNIPQSSQPSSQAGSPTKPLPAPTSAPAGTELRPGATTDPVGGRLNVARVEQQAPPKLGDGPSDEVSNQADRQVERASQKSVQVDQGTTPPTSPSQVTRATSVMPPPATPDESKPMPPAEQESQRANNLAREVESMVKQVVTKQLQSLDSPAGQTQWLLELPFRTPAGLQALEADIRREQAREDNEHAIWTMRLRLDLPKLGPLNILLILRDERLNASLQAADPHGAEQIKQRLGELRARLEAREIEIASLHAGHRPFDRPAPPFEAPLVREQA